MPAKIAVFAASGQASWPEVQSESPERGFFRGPPGRQPKPASPKRPGPERLLFDPLAVEWPDLASQGRRDRRTSQAGDGAAKYSEQPKTSSLPSARPGP